MKREVFVLLLAVLLPKLSECFLFGLQLTNTNGDVFAGANPAQTAGIFGLGALGSALGVAALSTALNPPRRTVTRTRTIYRRGRRNLDEKV